MTRALLVALLTLSLVGVSQAGNTGPFCGFRVCEIAHPDTCWTIGLWHLKATCADFAGSFNCEHGPTCLSGGDCSCKGPGIADTAGLFIQQLCECNYGLKAGCYLFNQGVLEGPMNLKKCKKASAAIYGGDSECWCQGGGNTEGSSGGP